MNAERRTYVTLKFSTYDNLHAKIQFEKQNLSTVFRIYEHQLGV